MANLDFFFLFFFLTVLYICQACIRILGQREFSA